MPVYQSWCMRCCCTYHPLMLTGYCISSQFDGVGYRCDGCGYVGDLALVKVPEGVTQQGEKQ